MEKFFYELVIEGHLPGFSRAFYFFPFLFLSPFSSGMIVIRSFGVPRAQ